MQIPGSLAYALMQIPGELGIFKAYALMQIPGELGIFKAYALFLRYDD